MGFGVQALRFGVKRFRGVGFEAEVRKAEGSPTLFLTVPYYSYSVDFLTTAPEQDARKVGRPAS